MKIPSIVVRQGVASALRCAAQAIENGTGELEPGKVRQLAEASVMGQLLGAIITIAEHWGMNRDHFLVCLEETWPPSSPPSVDQICRECGCTDEDCARCVKRTGAPCWWVERDLCSACQEQSG